MYVALTNGVDYSSTLNSQAVAFRGFIVGVAGNVNIVGLDGNSCVLPAMVAGVTHPCAGQGILASGTTATGIVAVF
jgi:hypothetical protein